jgi:hypothetical protein
MAEHPYLQWPVFRRSIVAAFDRSLTAASHSITKHAYDALQGGAS